jgi:hypothetical protein
MERNEKIFNAKQSENRVYWFRFGLKWKIRIEKKWNEAKKKLFFLRERAKRISFRFEAKPAHHNHG